MHKPNRKVGGQFEQEFAEILAKRGFWVHVLQQNKSGQPADIIAVKGKYHTLIDCKVISDNRGFPMSRAEENQRLAMEKFAKKGGNVGWFALKFPDGEIRMLSYNTVKLIEQFGGTYLSESNCKNDLDDVDSWMELVDKKAGESR